MGFVFLCFTAIWLLITSIIIKQENSEAGLSYCKRLTSLPRSGKAILYSQIVFLAVGFFILNDRYGHPYETYDQHPIFVGLLILLYGLVAFLHIVFLSRDNSLKQSRLVISLSIVIFMAVPYLLLHIIGENYCDPGTVSVVQTTVSPDGEHKIVVYQAHSYIYIYTLHDQNGFKRELLREEDVFQPQVQWRNNSMIHIACKYEKAGHDFVVQ